MYWLFMQASKYILCMHPNIFSHVFLNFNQKLVKPSQMSDTSDVPTGCGENFPCPWHVNATVRNYT